MKPLSINLYLPEGDPNGIVIVSSPNWTGECLKVSRLNINKALERYKQPKVFKLNENAHLYTKVEYICTPNCYTNILNRDITVFQFRFLKSIMMQKTSKLFINRKSELNKLNIGLQSGDDFILVASRRKLLTL